MTAPAVPRIRLWVIWVVGLAAYMVGVISIRDILRYLTEHNAARS